MSEDDLQKMIDTDLALLRSKAPTSGVSYYTDAVEADESGGSGGTLFKPALRSNVEENIRKVRGGRVLDELKSGTKIPTSIVRRLSEGVDPISGDILNKQVKAYYDNARRNPEKNKKKNGEEAKPPRLGYDLTFTIDKAVSLIWAELQIKAAKNDLDAIKTMRKMEILMETSTAKAIQIAYDNEIFRTRRVISSNQPDPETGKMKRVKTEYSEPVADLTTALYLHKTARPTGNDTSNGDPHLHVHTLIFNSVTRQDGTIGALDSTELYKMRPFIDATFKASFYEGLLEMDEFSHLEIIKKDKAIEIGGISQELVQEFSARRLEILDELEENEIPITNREAATIAAKKTRKSKDDQPPVSILVHEWIYKRLERSH